MSEENDKPERRAPVRAPAKRSSGNSGKSRSRSRSSKPSSGGGANKAVLAVVLTVVVIGGAAFGLGAFDSPKKEDPKVDKKTEVADAAPKKKGSSVFDAGAVSNQETAPKHVRVTGRAPKTIKKMKQVTKHLGHLYISKELEEEIHAFVKDVETYKRERWDADKKLRARKKRLIAKISTAKADRFLSGADADLKSFNDFTRRREVHLRGADDSLLPEPFIGIAHEPYVFMVQAHKDGGEKEIADEVYGWMVQLKAEFQRYFDGTLKLEPKDKDSRIKIVLFRKYKDYANYNRIKNPERDISFALAHYEPDKRRLCVPLDFGGRISKGDKKHAFREVMFHEGTHQVMHYFTNKSHLSAYGAMWSDEGVAEYFAGHAIEDGKIKFGRINNRIESVAMDDKDNKNRITMIELLTWSRAKMERAREKGKAKEYIAQRIHSHVYSQGWAMVYFFNNFKGGIYKDKFMEIMKLQIEDGDVGLTVWRRLFSDAEFDKIEVQYFDYLDKMTDAYRTPGVIKNHTWIEDDKKKTN